jgi:hypothetical protein
VFAAGEVRYLWQRGLLEDRWCGCGERFTRCPFWQDVLGRAFGSETLDVPAIAAEQRRAIRLRRLRPRRGRTNAGVSNAHVERLAALYRAIAVTAGARVVVDSSKLPTYGLLLAAVPSVDLRVVHLVRDPRAVAYSWQREKAQPDRGDDGLMQRRSAFESAVLWSIVNGVGSARLGAGHRAFLRVRYEDLVDRPEQAVKTVLALTSGSGTPPPIIGRTVSVTASHSVAGNPDRLESGPFEIAADSAWIKGLSRRDEVVTTALAAPFLRRYGYVLRGRRGHLR